MKPLKILLVPFLLLASAFVIGQTWQKAPVSIMFLGKTYNKATITYENGAQKNGYVAIPKTCSQKEISFKTDKASPVLEIQSTTLKTITVHNQDSSEYIFERVYYVLNPGDKPKNIGWLYIMAKGYATLYFRIDKFKIDKDGTLIFIAEEGLPMNFLMKKGEKTAVLVSTTNPYPGGVLIGSNRPFKKNGPVLFAEHKELVDQINAGMYTSKDILEVVKIYNQFMEGK